ncbi:MAG: ABC transporter substrate-binding protein [Micromonosporaceae bacterium]
MNPDLSRRRFLALSGGAAVAATVGLSGCGASGDTLRATWWGDPVLNKAVRKALDRYEKSKDGAEVRSESLPFDGYWDKLATLTASRNAPDLVMQAASFLPEYAEREALLDLDKHGDQLRLDNIDKQIRDFGSVDGTLYAVVAATNALGLIHNKRLLSDAKVTLPTKPWSWDDLATIARKLRSSLGSNTYGLQDSGGDLILFTVFVRDRGKELYDTAGKIAVTRDDVVDWFTYWDELRDGKAVPAAAVTAQMAGQITQSPLVAGKAALGFGWTQDIVTYASSMKDEVGVVLPPWNARTPGLWVNAASLWSASAHTEKPEKAASLIDFLVNDKGAADALGVALGAPPSAATRERLRGKVDETERLALDFMDTVTAHSRPLNRLWPKGFTALREEFDRLNQAVGFGKTSIDSAADKFFKAAGKDG